MSERDGPFLPILLTVALFFSGFFVFFTPLPLVYFLLRRRGRDFFPFAIPSLFIVLAVYVLGVQFLPALYASHPATNWLLPLPGLALLQILPARTVVILGIAYFGFYVFLGYVIFAAFRHPTRTYQILFGALLGCFLVGVIALLVTSAAHWQEFLQMTQGYLTQAADDFIAMQGKANVDAAQLVFLKQSRDSIVTYALVLAPVFFFNSLTFLFAINLIVVKRFFTAFFPELAQVKLGQFQIPFVCVWLVIAIVAFLLANHQFLHNTAMQFVGLNLLLAVAVFYLFQGFAVFVYFLDSRKIFGLVRMLSYLLLFLFLQSAWLFLVITGFFESWLDVRKLNVVPEKTKIVL